MSEYDIQKIKESADASLESGNIQEAISGYSKITQLHPGNAAAWLTLGELQGEAGLFDDGISSIERSISLNEDHADAWLSLAYLHQAKGDLEQAMKSGLRATNIDIEMVEAWIFLSGIAGQLNKFEEAENCSTRALELDPENSHAHANYANALYHQGKVVLAEDAYRKAIKLEPRHVPALIGLTALLLGLKQTDEAGKIIQDAIPMAPEYVTQSMYAIGTGFLGTKNSEAAIALFDNLLIANPQFANAHLCLGKAYLMDERLDDASASLEQALKLEPGLTEAEELLKEVQR